MAAIMLPHTCAIRCRSFIYYMDAPTYILRTVVGTSQSKCGTHLKRFFAEHYHSIKDCKFPSPAEYLKLNTAGSSRSMFRLWRNNQRWEMQADLLIRCAFRRNEMQTFLWCPWVGIGVAPRYIWSRIQLAISKSIFNPYVSSLKWL